MPALVHTTFRVSNAKQFKESFEEKTEHGVGGYIPMSLMYIDPITLEPSLSSNIDTPAKLAKVNSIPFYALDDQMYLFIGRVSAWNSTDTPDGSIDPNINENNPPYPVDSMKDAHFNHWDDMIAAKKVSAKEVSHVVKRERADEIKEGVRNWTRGMRYDTYDDRADNLFDDDIMIHTVNERFRVYKCLKQGVGRFVELTDTTAFASAPSGIDAEYVDTGSQTIWVWDHASYREPKNTIMEAGVSEDFMTVGGDFQDGYQWKYYYTIDAGEALKFVTTSYIPVRTIRKENGSRVDDFSDQWKVEEASLPGGIMNVLVDKVPVEGTDGTVYGYELTGGGVGYFQACVANNAGIMDWDNSAGAETLTFRCGAGIGSGGSNFADDISKDDTAQLWPEPAAAHANQTNQNQFKFNDNTQALGKLFETAYSSGGSEINALFKNYCIVIDEFKSGVTDPAEQEILNRYCFPIDTVTVTGSDAAAEAAFSINTKWLRERLSNSTFGSGAIQGMAAIPTNMAAEVAFSIHPKVNIKTNHQASTVCDRTDSFEAYAIVEPFFDVSTHEYLQGNLGRVVDVRVLNPGRFHYRIDEAWLAPQVDSTNAVVGNEIWNDYVYNFAVDLPTLATFGAGYSSVSNKALQNAKVFACIPPVGGHGFDPVAELGGFNVMINARFEGTEADEFTVGNEFRKIGILKNPLSYANTALNAAGYAANIVRNELNALWMGDGDYTNLFRGYKTDQCYRINLDDDSFQVADWQVGGSVPGTSALFFEPDMEVGFYAYREDAACTIQWESSTRYDGTNPLKYHHTGTDLAGYSQVPDPNARHTAIGDYIARAKLVDHDKINKRIRVIKPRDDFYTILQGTPDDGTPAKNPAAWRIEVRSLTPHSVEGDNVFATTLQTVNTAEEPGMLPGSGQILYVENRSMVSRSQNQTEDLKISIQF